MVVADYIVQAYLNAVGGEEFYFSVFSLLFVFAVIYFFYKVSE